MTGSETPKTITLLGATGSVGDSVLSVIASQPARFKLHAVVARNSATKLARIAISAGAKSAVLAEEGELSSLRDALAGTGIQCAAGPEAVEAVATEPVDLVVAAIVGAAGIRPTWAALKAGNQIALANKECMVSAGNLFMSEARRQNKPILPVDSEHNAIWQVFDEDNKTAIEAVTITASGGPFRTWSQKQIASATPQQALNHPIWEMGSKITIDSASLMNKGLELIEAKHLFGLEVEQLRVLVHPQSIIHGLVHYSDGSVLAQLGCADMRVPVSYCLNWPSRGKSPASKLDFSTIATLTFEPPDLERFPCLQLAYEAMSAGGAATCALNAANEIAVAAFLDEKIPFGGIAHIVDTVLQQTVKETGSTEFENIDQAIESDRIARGRASKYLQQKQW
ncbi:1-deoxy-D-xylulose-5-phosphate reductoisomerase [Pararhizobium sp. IMCC21322]|uniref:1-deoxy-D-xylulose-5-phosphate reductoisomerase n=1 Tax=Pararhizobium sp. IMCC21322 TaxID=3067903 RepID=UPI0027426D98|nr:1-deoxy-D-xylulose-5-phosphate reductoisomerase [Pararhizobium sp. IMCC21322]